MGACRLFSFNMTLMERCRTAMIQNQWAISKLKGDCIPDWTTRQEETLQTCMMSPKPNQVAVCRVSYDGDDLRIIKEKERNIKENEDIIQAHQELIKKEMQEKINQMQEFIKNKKRKKQRFIVHLKQIFEGL